MDKTLTDIFGSNILSEDMKASLQEAFDKKLLVMREEVEMQIRQEFGARFETEKANLVSAIDAMVKDVVSEMQDEKLAELKQLREARERFESAVVSNKKQYRSKIKEHVDLMQSFIMESMKKEITGLRKAKKACNDDKKKMNESFEIIKSDLLAKQAKRIAKIDKFVTESFTKEFAEFEKDRAALNLQRLKFVTESKKKIAAIQSKFIKESSRKVEQLVTATLKTEMKSLYEDIERNRQNTFGRRLFESVYSEFADSFFSKDAEMRKLKEMFESAKAESATTKAKLDEAIEAKNRIERKTKLAEERAERTKIMSELLSNLKGDKKSIMESMLETTKTEHLRTSFERLLPVVLSETKKNTPSKLMLNENNRSTRKVVTGDKPMRMVEDNNDHFEMQNDAELASIIHLAGISK